MVSFEMSPQVKWGAGVPEEGLPGGRQSSQVGRAWLLCEPVRPSANLNPHYFLATRVWEQQMEEWHEDVPAKPLQPVAVSLTWQQGFGGCD